MNCETAFIFLVIHLSLCNQVAKSSLNKPAAASVHYVKKHQVSNSTNCNKIKCPSKEQPECVKLWEKTGYSQENIYVIVINKCEIEYIKCHKGLEAVVVPMRNCIHKHAVEHHVLAKKKRIKRSPDIATKTFHNNYSGSKQAPKQVKSSNKIKYDSLYFGSERRDLEVDVPKGIVEERFDFGEWNGIDGLEVQTLKYESYKENRITNPGSNNKKDSDQDENTTEEQKHNDNADISEGQTEEPKKADNEEDVLYEDNSEQENEDGVKPNTSNYEELTPIGFGQESRQHGQDDNIENFNQTPNSSLENIEDSEKTELSSAEAKAENNYNKKNEKFIPNNQVENPNPSENEGMQENESSVDSKTDNEESEIVENNESSPEESSDVINNNSITYKGDPSVKDSEHSFTMEDKISNKPGEVDYDGVDKEQYQKDCPSVCPVRDVMLCARCKEGIYRTFLSVCHLRMFNCKYPEEKLELISRQPCILSAPFLNGMPKSKGRVGEPEDEDRVLRYIRCRERGDLEDPRCKF